MIDLEFDDGSFTEEDLAHFAELGRQAKETGESWLEKASCEGRLQELQDRRAQFVAFIARAEKANPSDPKIPRGEAVIAEIDTHMQVLHEMRLQAWPVDRRFPN